MKKKKIVFIAGPTAVGKTKLAIKLAKKIDGEIISCDSMQVYKDLDILSCKPSNLERKQIKHHLIDIISSSQNFDVAKFIKISKRSIEEIHGNNKIPVFVGGTGLYLDCLLNGIFQGPAKNLKVRNELYRKANKYGNGYLYKKLKKVDSEAAKKIHLNDLRRIVRALEVYQTTKIPFSVLGKQRKGILQDKRYRIYIFGLNISRDRLYKNINSRVDKMFKQGVVAEVRKVLHKRCSKTFKQALGIKELAAYLKGRLGLSETKDLLKRNTRRYAKRQLTWFRRNSKIKWLKNSDLGIILNSLGRY